ncbi:glutamine synthetase III [Clostridium sp. BJN0001]|uniref:glutamine synthetase III family protein n=1 Tax=Clostridium sp. BJN0001 TaxID=2930219 RepID=UPI001FD33194|nr:glutamine synthetase III [Clostridium sp. BJN0001]
MKNIDQIFGCDVFNDDVMKVSLPKATYKALKKTIEEGTPLKSDIADVVAEAMKNWAIEKGATHYTHWFQPMTGITAEKHDAFITPVKDGKVLLEFSGKELIQSEPDASSFPSGGLRATFEARGYTAWDCTSPAFVKDGSLCIPTAFCSYNGQALDKKTPLLRSMEAINKQGLRVLRLLGNTTTKKIIENVGPEQEYFLIDKKMYDARKDLILTGRTLFGAKPSKGQELDDHYFGTLRTRVSEFMKDLDEELWKLGITAKTKHNEVAPAQHELASVYTTANIATDNNQLVMEKMKKIAERHGLYCLLHEKPFAGVNGSGKHNNWSIGTDDGIQLLKPAKTPEENEIFLVFLCAVIKAVDENADLLRVSAANAGNDHRLGANEAPPAIISIFLGDEVTNMLKAVEEGKLSNALSKNELEIGVKTLPQLPKDTTDRNRTSPFAFTGNKFEFRMVASSASIGCCNYILNTIVADSLSQIADRLEKADDKKDALPSLLKELVANHKRVIFNGNGYSDEWVEEAEKRGLPNIKSTVESSKALIAEKNIKMFEKHKVLTKEEATARYGVVLGNYNNILNIEALTTLEMAKRQILPASLKYVTSLAESINAVKNTGVEASVAAQASVLKKVSALSSSLKKNIDILDEKVQKAENFDGDIYDLGMMYRYDVFEQMQILRKDADALEMIVAKEYWPMPTYEDMLFNI